MGNVQNNNPYVFTAFTSGSGQGTGQIPGQLPGLSGLPGTNGFSPPTSPALPPQNVGQTLNNALQTILPTLEHSGIDPTSLAAAFKQLGNVLDNLSSKGSNNSPITSDSGSGSSITSDSGSGSVTPQTTPTGSVTPQTTPTGGSQAQLAQQPADDPNAIQKGILQDYVHPTTASQTAINALSNPSAQPDFQSHTSSPVVFQSVSGPTSLWGNGTIQNSPSGTAISTSLGGLATQGQVGDCYALASWSAWADQHPDEAKSAVRPDPSGQAGQYQVQLNYKDANGQSQQQWVSVDDKLPMSEQPPGSGKYVPAGADLPHDSDGNVILGPALVEKAYAKFNDAHQVTQGANQNPPLTGYAGIEGGAGPEALYTFSGKDSSTLLGQQGKTFADSGTTSTNVMTVLSAANQGKPVMTASKTTADGQANNGNEKPDENGIFTNHQYTVLGTSTDSSGNTVVELRNPQGDHTDQNAAGVGNNGVFTLTLQQYMNEFGQVSMGDE